MSCAPGYGKHPGFKAVQQKTAQKYGVKAAPKNNPRLNRVKG